jgi:hypothetical protein
MSNQNNPLQAILNQYANNSKPKYENKSEKTYDLKNYFNTHIKDGVKSATKQIRILPSSDGKSPFVEMYGHKIKVDGEWKTFPCLKHEKDEPCPFCEARQALLSTGLPSDKEIAKDYSPRMMYVVKIIDREKEHEGVKFWRFNHDYRKEGIYDKIIGVLNAIKKDITDVSNGRDLLLTINRNQTGAPIVSAVAAMDPTPLSEDETTANEWISDTRVWEDVYSVRSYDYLEIIVKGGTPAWDKENKRFVDKASLKSDSETEDLESELTLGVENVKANMIAAKQSNPQPEPKQELSEDPFDDLPF